MGCNGGYLSGAWNYFRSPGVVTGWVYGDKTWCQPYTFPNCDHHVDGKYDPCGATKPTPACKKACIPEYKKPFDQDRWTSSAYSVPSNAGAIQNEIMTNGPVEAAFSVYQDFLTYKSGVYSHKSGSMLGGHAIKIVGWGIESGTPYWLCANSWNEDWGDNGFFKIRRGFNECGI
jgi:cathepsin B